MGYGSYSNTAYDDLKSSFAGKSDDEVFANRTMMDEMSPLGLGIRESRDSDEHPQSLAIALLLDVTGSMGKLPKILARETLSNLMETLLNHGVKDPHVLFGGIGDQYSDSAPLQVGQFESTAELLLKWLTGLWLEGGGGGTRHESYPLAWLMAARHTSIDCFEKRGQKGFLFTVGDETFHKVLEPSALKKILGYDESSELTATQLFHEASRIYNIFHIHCQQGSYRDDTQIFNDWKELLGQRFFVLEDIEKVPEIVASTIALELKTADLDKLTSSFDANTAAIVKRTLGDYVVAPTTNSVVL